MNVIEQQQSVAAIMFTNNTLTNSVKFGSNKGQTKSKLFFQADISSQERTNKFDFVAMIPQVDLLSFVSRKKLKTLKRHFEIN